MITHIQLCLWAFAVLWKNKNITRIDRLRVWRKSINLFVCFLAFTDKERPKKQLRGAMICAFLSAVYDYETDWHPISKTDDSFYLELLNEHVKSESARLIGSELFKADLKKQLSEHGLERGSDALVFYHELIASEWMKKSSAEQIAQAGENLQIIDDLLDLKDDRAEGHTNCFLTGESGWYRQQATKFLESPFFQTLEQNSLVYHLLRIKCSRILGEQGGNPPTKKQLIRSCRPLTGIFAFLLTLAGFKILHLPWIPAFFTASGFAGITWSIMISNDLLDKNRDKEKGKMLAFRYPWHVFNFWKYVSGSTFVILVCEGMLWPQTAVFSFLVWMLGILYSVIRPRYPINNLLVAFCSGSPILAGSMYGDGFHFESFLTFTLVFGTIAVTEVIKDIQDVGGDLRYKDTFPNQVGRFRAGLHSARLCYPLFAVACVHPNLAVRILGMSFPMIMVTSGVFFARFRSLYWAEKAGDIFLTLLLVVLLIVS
jgi:hypothetical protein